MILRFKVLASIALLLPVTSSAMEQKNHDYYKHLIEQRIAEGKKGDELAEPAGRDPFNLLYRTVRENHLDLLRLLLEQNVNPNITLDSPLQEAVLQGNLPAVQLLVSLKADVNFKAENNTPLHRLTDNKISPDKPALKIVRYLLKKKADPNALDPFGCTPLMNLAQASKKDIPLPVQMALAKMLIQRGANINLRSYDNLGPGSDHNNKTAIEIALIENKPELAQLMRETAIAKGQIPLESNEPNNNLKTITYYDTSDDLWDILSFT